MDFEQAVEDWKAHDQWEFADKQIDTGTLKHIHATRGPPVSIFLSQKKLSGKTFHMGPGFIM